MEYFKNNMNIPDHALQLTNDTIKTAKEIRSKCENCFSRGSIDDMSMIVVRNCCEEAKAFLFGLKYFPHKWSGFDIAKWDVKVDSLDDNYFFKFRARAEYPIAKKSELVAIPYALYELFKTVDTSRIDSLEDPVDILDTSHWMCETIVMYLTALKQTYESNMQMQVEAYSSSIPDNAERLIDNLITLLEKVLEYSRKYVAAPEPKIYANQLEYNYDEFCDYLGQLPYLWASLNPLTYEYNIKEEGEGLSVHFLHNKPENADNKPIIFKLPAELCFIFKSYPEVQPYDTLEQALYRVAKAFVKRGNAMLHALNTLLSEIGASQNYGKHKAAVVKDNLALENSEKPPRLIGNGREIICSKGEFNFTKNQAPIIEIFFENYMNDNEFLVEQVVLNKVKLSTSSFKSIFRSRKKSFDMIFERHETASDMWRLSLE